MIDYGFGVELDTIGETTYPFLRDWRNDVAIRSWCRQVGLISDLDQRRWYERQNDDPSIRMFLVKNDDILLGVCGLTDIDLISRRAEFSLYIKSASQRQGSGRKALKTLFSFGFNELGLNRIWGETFEGNPALELFQSLGMKIEGVREEFYFKNGRFINSILISIGARQFTTSLDAKTSTKGT